MMKHKMRTSIHFILISKKKNTSSPIFHLQNGTGSFPGPLGPAVRRAQWVGAARGTPVLLHKDAAHTGCRPHGVPCSSGRSLGKASLWLLLPLTKITLAKWVRGWKRSVKRKQGQETILNMGSRKQERGRAATSVSGGSSLPATLGGEHKDKPTRSEREMTKKLNC